MSEDIIRELRNEVEELRERCAASLHDYKNMSAHLAAKIADLELQLATSEDERFEQARLLGMSAEREVAIHTKIEYLREKMGLPL